MTNGLISIFSLIYKSTAYADSLWEEIQRIDTDGQPPFEFFFLANNATDEVLDHLMARKYPHAVRRSPKLRDIDCRDLGLDQRAYMHDVYSGWNAAIRAATGDILVPVNSDHKFMDGWLAQLYSRWNETVALSPLTIEPGNDKGFCFSANATPATRKDCGRSPSAFDRAGFEAEARKITTTKMPLLTPGGVYMPVMVSRSAMLRAGMYPCGNPNKTYGDRVLFDRLEMLGIKHLTTWSTACYHFQEGEMRS